AADHADDLAHRDAPPLPGENIAAPGPAHALQDVGAHQLLHDLLEIALGNALAPVDLLGLHRFGAAVVGNVHHRLEGEQHLLRQLEHGLRSPSDAGGSEAAGAAARVIELLDDPPLG